VTATIATRSLGRSLAVAVVAVVAVVGCNSAPTPPPPTPVPIVFAPIEVTGIGEVRQGTASGDELVVRLTELEGDSLPAGPGAFELTLTDSAGGRDAVSFRGTPTLLGPGSLGATATLTRSNILTVQIVDTDTFNIEQLSIGGLRISAAATAPVGDLGLTIDACTRSLAGCAATNVLASPGSVVTSP
jgi:hypothetical protein